MTYDRAKLEAELIRDEGERFTLYRCTAGKRSIGIGRNLDDVGIRPAEQRRLGITVASCVTDGITRAQSRALLASDIDACEAEADRRFPWWRALDPVRQRVILNMLFNMGGATLATFRNTLAAFQRHDFAAAARGMRASRWHDQVGARAIRLEHMTETGEPA